MLTIKNEREKRKNTNIAETMGPRNMHSDIWLRSFFLFLFLYTGENNDKQVNKCVVTIRFFFSFFNLVSTWQKERKPRKKKLSLIIVIYFFVACSAFGILFYLLWFNSSFGNNKYLCAIHVWAKIYRGRGISKFEIGAKINIFKRG